MSKNAKKIAELEAILEKHERKKKIAELEAILEKHERKEKIAELEAILEKHGRKKKIAELEAELKAIQEAKIAKNAKPVAKPVAKSVAKLERKKVNFGDHASVINITKLNRGRQARGLYGEDNKFDEKVRLCESTLHITGMKHFGVRRCPKCNKNICDACRDKHMEIKHMV